MEDKKVELVVADELETTELVETKEVTAKQLLDDNGFDSIAEALAVYYNEETPANTKASIINTLMQIQHPNAKEVDSTIEIVILKQKADGSFDISKLKTYDQSSNLSHHQAVPASKKAI